jgi:hypothetical protein
VFSRNMRYRRSGIENSAVGIFPIGSRKAEADNTSIEDDSKRKPPGHQDVETEPQFDPAA